VIESKGTEQEPSPLVELVVELDPRRWRKVNQAQLLKEGKRAEKVVPMETEGVQEGREPLHDEENGHSESEPRGKPKKEPKSLEEPRWHGDKEPKGHVPQHT